MKDDVEDVTPHLMGDRTESGARTPVGSVSIEAKISIKFGATSESTTENEGSVQDWMQMLLPFVQPLRH